METLEAIELPVEIELNGREAVEVTAVFEYEGGLDGIGAYEYQGQKCVDNGEWRVEGIWFKEFSCDEALTPEEKKQIEIYLESYAETDRVTDAIYQNLSC